MDFLVETMKNLLFGMLFGVPLSAVIVLVIMAVLTMAPDNADKDLTGED